MTGQLSENKAFLSECRETLLHPNVPNPCPQALTQLIIACSKEKQGEPGMMHTVSDVGIEWMVRKGFDCTFAYCKR